MDKPNRPDSDLMTPLEQLVEEVMRKYVQQGESMLSPETATLAANALAAAMKDRGYDDEQREEFFVRVIASCHHNGLPWHDALICAMAEGFGYDVMRTDLSPEGKVRYEFTPRRVQ